MIDLFQLWSVTVYLEPRKWEALRPEFYQHWGLFSQPALATLTITDIFQELKIKRTFLKELFSIYHNNFYIHMYNIHMHMVPRCSFLIENCLQLSLPCCRTTAGLLRCRLQTRVCNEQDCRTVDCRWLVLNVLTIIDNWPAATQAGDLY